MQPETIETGAALRQAIKTLQQQLDAAVCGQSDVVERILVCLLCNGNLLLEGLPGTAKTRLVKTLATLLDAKLGRVQFTPDLLPADITGTEVYHHEAEQLQFQPGPLFNNLVLADEINRAPPKVQAALLEAMEERQITVAGTTYPLPPLFMVLATQNPIEQEGTYPLPEAQVDRFLLKVRMTLADDDAEREILHLMRREEGGDPPTPAVLSGQQLFSAREAVRQVYMSPAVEDYLLALVMATRHPERYLPELAEQLDAGVSSRATVALDRTVRAHAWLQGRDYVTPDDLRLMVADVLRHRLPLSYEARAAGIDADQLIHELVRAVPVP